ncbi:MAG: hypothetical protein L0207_06925 [Chlamydiae bacterium]|nr:hypothetical protein [Chlamydiota bacterium]
MTAALCKTLALPVSVGMIAYTYNKAGEVGLLGKNMRFITPAKTVGEMTFFTALVAGMLTKNPSIRGGIVGTGLSSISLLALKNTHDEIQKMRLERIENSFKNQRKHS